MASPSCWTLEHLLLRRWTRHHLLLTSDWQPSASPVSGTASVPGTVTAILRTLEISDQEGPWAECPSFPPRFHLVHIMSDSLSFGDSLVELEKSLTESFPSGPSRNFSDFRSWKDSQPLAENWETHYFFLTLVVPFSKIQGLTGHIYVCLCVCVYIYMYMHAFI